MAEECFSYIPYLLGSFLDARNVWLASERALPQVLWRTHDAHSASTSRGSWRQPTGHIPLVIGKVTPCHLAARIEWRGGWRSVDLDRLKETYRLCILFLCWTCVTLTVRNQIRKCKLPDLQWNACLKVKCWCPYLWPYFSVWMLSVRLRTETLRLPDSCSCSARSEFRPHWLIQPLQANAGRVHPFEAAQCRHRRCRQIATKEKEKPEKWLIFSFADDTVVGVIIICFCWGPQSYTIWYLAPSVRGLLEISCTEFLVFYNYYYY